MTKWMNIMLSFFTRKNRRSKPKAFEIEPKIVNGDVYRVDMKSLRKSRAVRKQLEAAQRSFEKEKATA